MFGELGLGEVAGGYGEDGGIDGLCAMDVGGGVADDEDFGWVEVGELVAGAFECSAGYFVSVFGGVAKGAKFKTMPEIVVDEFEFRAYWQVASEQAERGRRGHGLNGIEQLDYAGKRLSVVRR